MGFLDCWSIIQDSGTKLTVLVSGRNGRNRDIFDGSARSLHPGRCRDFGVISPIGRRMNQGLEGSSDTVGDEAAVVEEGNASIYDNLGHLPDFIPWHEYELVTLRMAVQVDSDHTARVGFSIRVADWNLDIVVSRGMCTSSEDTGQGAAR